MTLQYREENGELVWVRNPFTGTITYFTHLHRKRSGFTRRAVKEPPVGDAAADRPTVEAHLRGELDAARRSCAFCPGNEDRTPSEVLRVTASEVFSHRTGEGWLIRAVPNLIPRIPECCTGNRNESYVVIEDPRHFADDARSHEHLLHTGALPLEQFQALLTATVAVTRRSYANPSVTSVLIRKNQGRQSGASQPHVHTQVIGSGLRFPWVAGECEVLAQEPHLWHEILNFARARNFMVEEREGCYAYFCPFGVFPRSYEVVCLEDWVRWIDLPTARRRTFATLLFKVLELLGPMPLDYEIHAGPGVPIHAHVNARHYAYSNIGGTLNLPSLWVGDGREPGTV